MPIIEVYGKKPVIHESCFIAPNATIVGDVRIKADSSVWFNAVLRGDQRSIEVGEMVSIQDNVVIHPDQRSTVIGNRVTIGHGAILEGVYIEDEVLIGIGAIVLEGVRIGRNSLIGAGSLVPSNMEIPEESLVMGVPAKIVGKVEGKHLKIIHSAWSVYRDHKDEYKRSMRVLDTFK